MKVQRNLKLFYIYIFLNRLEMWLPIVVLFLLDKGLSLAQYASVDAIWYASTLVFEIPTGVIADRYGKRMSLFLAVSFQSLSLFILAFGGSFLAILIAYILWGFAASFETGTHDALVYDTLRQLNREDEYRKVTGRIRTLSIIAGAFGSVLAGYLGSIRLSIPIILTASIALFLCPLVLFFKEPDVVDIEASKGYLHHIKASLRYISSRRLVALLLLYASILGTVIWGLLIFYQPLLASFGFSVQHAGILYLFFRLFGAAGASASEHIYKVLGISTVYLIPLCLTVSVLGLGYFITPWVVIFIFVIFFVEGLYYPIVNDLLNKNIPSSQRATIISLGSVLACLIETISYPLLGKMADIYSLQTPLRILGFGFLICMGVILFLLFQTPNGRGVTIVIGAIRAVLGKLPAVERFDAVVTVLFYSGKLVMVENDRRGWEFPGGHRDGDETYERTAQREALEEAGAKIGETKYLGYYVTPTGHVTVITCAEVVSFAGPVEERAIARVGLFDRLPPGLSFGDGREQLFLDHARAIRSGQGA